MTPRARDRWVLDTSALLAFFQKEAGSEQIETLLRSGQELLVPFVVLLEVYYVTLQLLGEEEADLRLALLKELPVEFVHRVDEPWLLTAAEIKARHRLSLADALVAGLARTRSAALMHRDPEFRVLAPEIDLEELAPKS